MLSIVNSMSLTGLDGYKVSVQVDISPGIPTFGIVGLPDASIKESKERVLTAIKNSGIPVLSKKIIINLAPANTRKEGSIFDLPMAVGILIATNNIKNEYLDILLKETAFVGELSLNGHLNRISGALPICIEAKKLGIKRVILPEKNKKEVSIVEGIEIIPLRTLADVISYLNNYKKTALKKNEYEYKVKNISYDIDFSEVKGQENVKRALEIAAAGWHNCLLMGAPGTGKTMLAQRIPTILPDMTFEEMLEVTKIYSISGNINSDNPLINQRPFRNPHYIISAPSLIGGGKHPRPGEISLAHNGVLFLDELPEFNRNTLETLREPLENKKIKISRLRATVEYPCNFMFVASMNPCPCGYYGSTERKCSCTEEQIKSYINKISGPLLDRIDLHIEVNNVKYKDLSKDTISTDSKTIKQRVDKARQIQVERYKNYGISSNAELKDNLIDNFCKLDREGNKILNSAFNNFGLSARAYTRILKVARTIADLDNSKNIKAKHVAEAIQYRNLDRKYWGT